MVKITEVAERAGVSAATVSRVLNGDDRVRPAARERVRAAVAELGYRPNRLASNLRRQRAEMIGVVIPDVENPHFYGMVRVVEAAAYQRGFRVLLCNIGDSAEKQRAYLRVLAAERVVGVVLTAMDAAGEEIGRLVTEGVPVVAYDRLVADPRVDAVVADNAEGARRATDHLLRAGHERVGFVAGLSGLQIAADRLAGYEQAMREAGLPPRVAIGHFRPEGAYGAAGQLLDGPEPVTALVVASNLMTIGVLRALRARRARVPEDVALVAIDDPFWADLVDPPLTTLAQPVQRMAERTAKLLFERINGERDTPQHVVFDFELRVRQSSGVLSAEC